MNSSFHRLADDWFRGSRIHLAVRSSSPLSVSAVYAAVVGGSTSWSVFRVDRRMRSQIVLCESKKIRHQNSVHQSAAEN